MKKKLTFSSTVFLIFTLASTTVFPALFTALYKNPPKLFAPASAFVETGDRKTGKGEMRTNATIVRKRDKERENFPLSHLTRE